MSVSHSSWHFLLSLLLLFFWRFFFCFLKNVKLKCLKAADVWMFEKKKAFVGKDFSNFIFEHFKKPLLNDHLRKWYVQTNGAKWINQRCDNEKLTFIISSFLFLPPNFELSLCAFTVYPEFRIKRFFLF